MRATSEAVLLRIFVGDEDRYGGRRLYEAIVARALESHMAGATVLLSVGGFGRSRHIHTGLNIDAGINLPVVVEIVDRPDAIDQFLPELDDMVDSGLVSLERVRTIHYSDREHRP